MKRKKDAAMNGTNHSTFTTADDNDKKKKKKEQEKPQASLQETLGFVFYCGPQVRFLFCIGIFAGVLNGLVYPALAYVFSTSFSDISGAAFNGLDSIRRIAYIFMFIGVYALLAATVQSWSFELVAYHASQSFRLRWFDALLHQDAAFFDVYDIGGVAAQVGSNANKFRRGVGRKFGEGIQFLTTGVGGLAFAFYISWRVALVILCVVPFASLAALMVIQLNQSKGARAAKSYKHAGSVAYSAVSSIKTVLSLNAIQDMVLQYKEATLEAFHDATGILWKQGFANGAMLGSFLLLYCILTLYGTSLLYKDVRGTGCDPSGAVEKNTTCESSGPDVFGAMLGVAFAAQGISQVGTFLEALTAARMAAYEALLAIDRKPGDPEEIIYKTEEDDDLGTTSRSRKSKDVSDIEAGEKEERKEIKAILPKFEIDSASEDGLKPPVKGAITFQDVHFSYPTRPGDEVLCGMNTTISAGEVVAFVGPSGGGKSTTVAMIERFYDPLAGKVLLDGLNLKDINVTHLRRSIGYVGQEPTLFATTIRGNIQYGNPDATQEQIEEAARLANCHGFITAFPDGYDTQVGDKGSQLSGGQKQRIAIARVLVGNPKILILDEATSALDSESELVVQDALDNIMQRKKITTVIIAHRLSTIRNADRINVVVGGRIAESGSHDELMARQSYYFRLVEKQEGRSDEKQSSAPSSRRSSYADLTELEQDALEHMKISGVPHIEFKDVSFSYPTRPKRQILNDFNLTVPRGSTVALCGPSGQGKSTTVGLIERFYDPSDGEILYLGNDIKTLNTYWYRSQLAYVGQEPVLFNLTIAENIAFGAPGVSRADIEQAARLSNAHEFIVEFPEGYETPVGSRGTQLSGGQKQRVAIARALVRKPQILILDEATSALDTESESLVQSAIDGLMESRDQTVIVIAHRLSTIRNADYITFIAEGKVLEYGSHEELIEKPHGRYKRLVESSKRRSTVDSVGLRRSVLTVDTVDEEEEEEIDWEAKIKEEEEKAFNVKRARQMAKPDAKYMLVGAVGALMAGGVFPVWGLLFSETINLLFSPVLPCLDDANAIPFGFNSCQEYWDFTAESMQQKSFRVAGYWVAAMAGCVFGNMLTFWGFGTASERLNKRVRDSSFLALLRQEVSFFDKRSVGSITSQLQDDAARIHSFSGQPVRSFIIAVSSMITGIVLSFVFMWQFALVALGCIPIMGFATSLEMKRFLGEDVSDADGADELNSPGGILVETLLNMRTVSALTLENTRYEDYDRALLKSEPNYRFQSFMSGLAAGFSMFVQQWINALQLWFGGWLLVKFPETYQFNDFLIANFSILFALFGLSAAFQDMADRKEVEKSAGRVFYLLDRKSEIDPISSEGKKLD